MRELTVGEWTSKRLGPGSKNILRRVTSGDVLRSYRGLMMGRWIKWRGRRNLGKVGGVIGIEGEVRAASVAHGRIRLGRSGGRVVRGRRGES
jgi:hypothetical protein